MFSFQQLSLHLFSLKTENKQEIANDKRNYNLKCIQTKENTSRPTTGRKKKKKKETTPIVTNVINNLNQFSFLI